MLPGCRRRFDVNVGFSDNDRMLIFKIFYILKFTEWK